METTQEAQKVSLATIGDSCVGKTSIQERYILKNFYQQQFANVCVEFQWRVINIDSK